MSEEEITKCIEDLVKEHPSITGRDIELIINKGYGVYFPSHTIKNWFKITAPFLTEENLKIIRLDVCKFLYNESQRLLEDYVPLWKRRTFK